MKRIAEPGCAMSGYVVGFSIKDKAAMLPPGSHGG